jgi:tetratricopeptide (TPR) repeat protein
VRNNQIAALGAALIGLAALGCTAFPSLRRDAGATPLGTPRPGPMKQLANAVSASSVGKSFSNAFKTMKKKPTHENDPTALATGIAPTTAADYVAMGENLEQNDDGEGARRMFHTALELEPHNLAALIGLGRHFDRQGQLDRATENYLEATKHYPENATAFKDLGLCYARQRRYDEAIRALNRAIELEPDRARYRNNIAMVLVSQNRLDEAIKHLTDAHGPATAHYNAGFLLNKQGQNEAALDQFKLALRDDPAMDKARQWVDVLSADPAEFSPEQMIASDAPAEDFAVETSADNGILGESPRVRENLAARQVAPRSASPGNLQPLPPVDDEPAPTTRRY